MLKVVKDKEQQKEKASTTSIFSDIFRSTAKNIAASSGSFFSATTGVGINNSKEATSTTKVKASSSNASVLKKTASHSHSSSSSSSDSSSDWDEEIKKEEILDSKNQSTFDNFSPTGGGDPFFDDDEDENENDENDKGRGKKGRWKKGKVCFFTCRL